MIVAELAPSIRQAMPADLDRLVEIDVEIFGMASFPRFVLRQYLDLFQEGFFVVERDGEILGYSVLGMEEGADTAWLLTTGLKRNSRGLGLGDALLRRSNDIARALGARRLKLTVSVDNAPAIQTYESKGFEIVSTEADYYDNGFSRHLMERAVD